MKPYSSPGKACIGEIFHYVSGRFDVHQRVYAITQMSPGVSTRFVHSFMAIRFGAWAMQNTVKATVDSLRLPTFQAFRVALPPTEEEQVAIATVLSDMDAEIAALERRRDKIRAIKQGMMQQLLTGRIRLVEPADSETGDGSRPSSHLHSDLPRRRLSGRDPPCRQVQLGRASRGGESFTAGSRVRAGGDGQARRIPAPWAGRRR
ncbi:MAG: restriction endonuclease subunit S [Gemmatimonadota bacterium]|nr:restriction endonuclease subunit S [Gemmatimonadota bacterium]